MVIKQSFNNRNKAWVKIEVIKGKGSRTLDVKQRNPEIPFKNIPKFKKK